MTCLNSKLCKFLGLVIVACLVLFVRRPDQLFNPYIWVEDGTILLPQYLDQGWSSIFSPVVGYIILPSKLIFISATKLSFLHQPAISYWLTVLFTILAVSAVAFSPTTLRWPFVSALSVLLIPTDPEIFAVSEYAFWWGSLLAIVPLFWIENNARPFTLARSAMVTIGGLSSPLIIGLTACYAMRLFHRKTKPDVIIFTTSVISAVIQITYLFYTKSSSCLPKINFFFPNIIVKFFGFFIYAPKLPKSEYDYYISAICGCIIIIFIGISLYHFRKKLLSSDFILIACLILSITASITRVPLDVIHPINSGPRYFFFPYIFLSFILIQIAAMGNTTCRIVVSIIFLLTFNQALHNGQRFHDRIDWSAEIRTCAGADSYSLPVHYTGDRNSVWHVNLKGDDCRRLINESIFGKL